MIPSTEFLEQHYEAREVAALEDLRRRLKPIRKESEVNNLGRRALRMLWDDEWTYMAKTHWLVRQKKPGPPQRLVLNYAQKKLREAMERQAAEGLAIRIICLKGRQLGFSTFWQSWMFEQCDRLPNRSALTLSYDDDSSTELFQKSRHLQQRMWFPHETGRDSGSVLELKDNNSSITVRTSGNLSAGRGDTYHYLHMSEVPMWANAGETMNSALQAVPDDAGTAVFIESTAKGATGEFYDEWCKAERGENLLLPFFAPWYWDPDYQTPFGSPDLRAAFAASLTHTEKQIAERHNLTLEQLHWRRRTIKGKCQGSEAKFRQEYPNTPREAFLTTGSPVFGAEAVAALEENCVRPLWVGDIHLETTDESNWKHVLTESQSGSLRVWDHPREGLEYVAGVDVSEGKKRDLTNLQRRGVASYSDHRPDYSAICLIELVTGLHCASWHGYVPPEELAAIAAALGAYYNNALLVPELNGPGLAVVTRLHETLRYDNLYRSTMVNMVDIDPLLPRFGFQTNATSRPLLIMRISEALGDNELWTRDEALVREIRTMEFDNNGVARGRGNNKDDRVMAMALAREGRYRALVMSPAERQPQLPPDRAYEARVWAHVKRRIEENRNGNSRDGLLGRPGRSGLHARRDRGSFGR